MDPKFDLTTFKNNCKEFFEPRLVTLDPRPFTLDPRPFTLDPRPFTLDPRPFTLDPRPFTLDPRPSTNRQTQLMHTVKSALRSQRKLNGVKFWLDSKTALSWIQNKGEWKQFVRHRVNEILKLSNKEDWAYCSTEENPADLGSRGVLASQLKGNQLWWCGPAWLTKQPEDWPVTTESFRTPESSIEEKKSVTAMLTGKEIVTGISVVIDINDYSSLQRLVRVTA